MQPKFRKKNHLIELDNDSCNVNHLPRQSVSFLSWWFLISLAAPHIDTMPLNIMHNHSTDISPLIFITHYLFGVGSSIIFLALCCWFYLCRRKKLLMFRYSKMDLIALIEL